MKARHKRLAFVGLAVMGICAASALALAALKSNISYFFSPSEVLANAAPPDHVFRLGGLVTKGSVARAQNGLTVTFDVTDNAETVRVSYTGILPDLFSEGTGVVAKGKLGSDGVFYAEQVLAKHDEEYVPPEVASTLKTAHAEGMSQGAATTTSGATN